MAIIKAQKSSAPTWERMVGHPAAKCCRCSNPGKVRTPLGLLRTCKARHFRSNKFLWNMKARFRGATSYWPIRSTPVLTAQQRLRPSKRDVIAYADNFMLPYHTYATWAAAKTAGWRFRTHQSHAHPRSLRASRLGHGILRSAHHAMHTCSSHTVVLTQRHVLHSPPQRRHASHDTTQKNVSLAFQCYLMTTRMYNRTHIRPEWTYTTQLPPLRRSIQ